MTFFVFIAIGIGAALGAWVRLGLMTWLNTMSPNLPMGTLSANLIGGYLVGFAMAYFIHFPHLTPEWRLVIITGFLGGLTTFSTFSIEVVSMISRGHYNWAVITIAVHLGGSLVMTFLGLQTFKWLQS